MEAKRSLNDSLYVPSPSVSHKRELSMQPMQSYMKTTRNLSIMNQADNLNQSSIAESEDEKSIYSKAAVP